MKEIVNYRSLPRTYCSISVKVFLAVGFKADLTPVVGSILRKIIIKPSCWASLPILEIPPLLIMYRLP